MHNDAGDVTGFEIGNLLIGRRGVLRVLKRIPAVTITKAPKAWAFDDDDFVHFTVNGHKFKAIEPFGDNDRYWIVAEDKAGRSEIEAIRQVFAERRLFGIF
jgi:hypothetical protein